MTILQSTLFWVIFSLLTVLVGLFLPRSTPPVSTENRFQPIALLILTVAFGIGAYLRFYHLDFGFPELYHPDEVRKARILRTMSESSTWNPKYFLHPSLLLYLAKILSRLFYSLSIYPEEIILRNVLAGRFVSACAGVGAIGASYLIGKELFRSSLLAALGALLVATCPLAIDCSHYFKEDSLFSFLLLLVFLVSLMATTSQKLVYVAGLLAGLCAGSKYTGFVAVFFPLAAIVLPPILAPILASNRIITSANFRAAFLVGLLAAIGFILTTPYSVITPGELLKGISFEKNHALNGHGGISISAWSRFFTYHLSRSLYPALSMPVLFIALLGVGRLLKTRTSSALLLLAGVVGFYLVAELVKSKPMPQPDRYALPATFFFIYSAMFFISQLTSLTLKMTVSGVLSLCLGYKGIVTTLEISPDTRDKMSGWVVEQIPRGKKFVLVGLPNYAPRLARYGYAIKPISPENGRAHTPIESLKKGNFDYLLVTSLSYDRFFREPEADQNLKQRFMEYDANLELVHQESARYGAQGFHNPELKLYKLK